MELGLAKWPAERHPPLDQCLRIAVTLPNKGHLLCICSLRSLPVVLRSSCLLAMGAASAWSGMHGWRPGGRPLPSTLHLRRL